MKTGWGVYLFVCFCLESFCQWDLAIPSFSSRLFPQFYPEQNSSLQELKDSHLLTTVYMYISIMFKNISPYWSNAVASGNIFNITN